MVNFPIMTAKKHREIIKAKNHIIYKQQKEINELNGSNDSRAIQIKTQYKEISGLKDKIKEKESLEESLMNKIKEKENLEENLINKIALVSTKLVRLQKEYDDLKESVEE